jgi:predicted TIM-barrel fold metal-dependent hydrolase
MRSTRGAGPAIGRYPEWSPERALDLMDANGIEVAITSLAQPGVQFGEAQGARAGAPVQRVCGHAQRTRPRRFGAFATVPMSDMRAAVEEIDYTLDVLKLQGVCLFASYGEKFLGDPLFDPVLTALDQRAAVVFVHPALHRRAARSICRGRGS